MKALTYDDIQLVPSFSSVKSRGSIDLTAKLSQNFWVKSPLVAAPMDTVCGSEMAWQLFTKGGAGCLHRFCAIDDQTQTVKSLRDRIHSSEFVNTLWKNFDVPIVAAVGVQKDDRLRATKLVEAGANVIVIDVAHGDHQNVIDMVHWFKENPQFIHVDVIAGNIATAAAAERLQQAGADGLRVGIGGGSLCTTRIKTGFGIPNVTSLQQISEVAKVPIIADGGIRNSGDIAKALAVGANTVMIGSLLAGTEEAPGESFINPNGHFKEYRGLASRATKSIHGQQIRNVEGESTVIRFKGKVEPILDDLLDGVRSALSYAGAPTLHDYMPDFVEITQAGAHEAKPHLL
jgi:IMP dehydrogenase/GMP reductase